MRVQVLGAGKQGQAAVYDLMHSAVTKAVTVADVDDSALRQIRASYSDRLATACVNAEDEAKLAVLVQEHNVLINLLPPAFCPSVARLAVDHGCHFIDASYAMPDYQELHEPARRKGIALLPEFGLDPGIDLVLAAKAIHSFDEVNVLNSYGAGIPEADATTNPLRYKISWSFAGVLASYTRAARLVRGGKPVTIAGAEIFAPKNVHLVSLAGVGDLEAYPNGDAYRYLGLLGIAGSIRMAGRYSMRWPGHTAFWYRLSRLGFLNETPVASQGAAIVPRDFLHDLLAPQLQYEEGERDLAIVALEVRGLRHGQPRRLWVELVDYRDLKSGLLAMQRTVGFTASIGAQMLMRGEIEGRGLLSPARDVPPEPFVEHLKQRGIRARWQWE